MTEIVPTEILTQTMDH